MRMPQGGENIHEQKAIILDCEPKLLSQSCETTPAITNFPEVPETAAIPEKTQEPPAEISEKKHTPFSVSMGSFYLSNN
jgi:hypothetical protein